MGATVVTGSSGFLGAHVVRAVADRGGRVIAADVAAPPAEVLALWADRDIEHRDLDVRAPATVFADVRPEVVIHVAAVTNADPETLHEINVGGTAAVLAAAGSARVVYVSSASVYADAAVLDETSAVRADPAGYPASKLAAERLAIDTGAVIARVAACYGPLERDTGARQVMSLPYNAIRAALAGRPLRADSGSSDPAWVGDIADALALLAATEDLPYRLYNVGSGAAISLAALADAVTAAVGAPRDGEDPFFLRLPAGHRTGVLDVARLRELGVPEPTPLPEALSAYLRWLGEHAY